MRKAGQEALGNVSWMALLCKGHQSFTFPAQASPPVPGLNHRCFPSNWPFPFTCFKSTVIYSALLPHPPPAARGSCRNCCSSGDTDGKVSLSEAERPAGLFSRSNALSQMLLYFIFTQKCNKTPRGKKKNLICRIRAPCISSQVWNKFCNYHISHREWWALRRWHSSGSWW